MPRVLERPRSRVSELALRAQTEIFIEFDGEQELPVFQVWLERAIRVCFSVVRFSLLLFAPKFGVLFEVFGEHWREFAEFFTEAVRHFK